MKQNILLLSALLFFINCDFLTEPENSPFETGTVKDINGNVYKTVKIGDQW